MPNNISGYLPSANAWFQQAPQQFPGSAIAGFTPLQQQSWGAGLGAANNLAQAATQGYGAYMGDRDLGKLGNPLLNRQVGNMWDTAYQGFRRNTIPSISDEMVRSGQGMGRDSRYGATRAGIAQGNAMEALNRQLLNAGTDMYSNAWGQGLNYTANMNQQMPGQLNALKLGQLAPSQMAGQIGQQQQAMNQARLSEGRDMYNQMMDAPMDRLTQYSNLVNPGAYSGYGSTTAPIGNQWSNMLGGAMMGGTLGNSLYNAWAPTSSPSASTPFAPPQNLWNSVGYN